MSALWQSCFGMRSALVTRHHLIGFGGSFHLPTDSAGSLLDLFGQPEGNVSHHHERDWFSVDVHLCELPLHDGRERGLLEAFAPRPEYASLADRAGGINVHFEEDDSFVARLK